MSSTELTTAQPMQLATANESEGASMLAIIQRAAKDPSCDVEKMERLLAMAERMQAKDAEKQFATAFAALQSEVPVIVASSVIPNRGRYEKYEDVMHVLRPLMRKHGFSVSFSQTADDKRITETCTVTHICGHSRANSFAVRLGGKADSDTQADCKASTTAKRNALLNAFDIIVRQDVLQGEDDAANEGAPIDFAQAQTLRELVRDTGSDEAAFLKYAGASKYEEIGAVKYDMLFRALNAKARK